jgi:hypothetical protein
MFDSGSPAFSLPNQSSVAVQLEMAKKKLIPANSLDIIDQDGQFAPAVRGAVLRTAGGNPVIHRTEHLLDHMISEFKGPRGFESRREDRRAAVPRGLPIILHP